MPTVIDLHTIASQGIVVVGSTDAPSTGLSVSDAGDVNGDGYEDVIIGGAGQAYVIFGQASGFDDIYMDSLSAADGFVIDGVGGGSYPGLSVSGAGDVNGDGFDDLIVGGVFVYGWYYYGSYPTAYVIYGKESGFGTVDVNNLEESDGFAIFGPWSTGYAGLEVSSAGDVNGDGLDDIIVGHQYDEGGAGAAYVIFGTEEDHGFLDLALLSASDGFKIIGEPESSDLAGFSVANAGDINGDGYDDIIIGAPAAGDANYAGEAYVIFGKASGFGTIDLLNLAADAGFVIEGGTAYDNAGFSVSGAGDVNGDGYDDIIIGAPYGSGGGAESGQAYVILGQASGFTTIDLAAMGGADWIIAGDSGGDHAGFSVAAAGDVNGDGYGDIIIGAPGDDRAGAGNAGLDAGSAYVIFGRASGFASIDLTNLASSDGFIIQGVFAEDLTGFSVSAAGDVDGDGYDDLVIGAVGSDRGAQGAGVAYILSGRQHFVLDVANDFNGDGLSDILWRNVNGTIMDWLGQADGSVINNYAQAGFLDNSWQLLGIGDINDDGREDLVVRNDSGLIMTWLGEWDGGFANNYANAIFLNPGWTVVGMGDVNGDGRDDLVMRNGDGLVMDLLGQANGGFTNNFANAGFLNPSWTVIATTDVNGDGREDLVLRQTGGLTMSWLGEANGGFTNNYSNADFLDPSWLLAGTGDFNGDGRGDLLWRHSTGLTMSWLGDGDGGFTSNHALADYISNSWHVIGTGDVNGDGRDDILWRNDNGLVMDWLGAPNGDFFNNFANAGFLDNSWNFLDTADYNGDGRADLLFRTDEGVTMTWLGLFNGSFLNNHAQAEWFDISWQVKTDPLM